MVQPAATESGHMSFNLRNVFHTLETIIVDKYKEERYFVQMSSLILNLPTQFFFHVVVTKVKLPNKDRMLLDVTTLVRRTFKEKRRTSDCFPAEKWPTKVCE